MDHVRELSLGSLVGSCGRVLEVDSGEAAVTSLPLSYAPPPHPKKEAAAGDGDADDEEEGDDADDKALNEALLKAKLERLAALSKEGASEERYTRLASPLLADHADSAAASSFLAGVLSMDDYPFFKREMLSLKRDLFAEPNFDALDAHVLAAGPLREPSRIAVDDGVDGYQASRLILPKFPRLMWQT